MLVAARHRYSKESQVTRAARRMKKTDLKKQKRKEAKDETEKKTKDNVIELDGEVIMHSRNIFKVMLVNGAEVQCTLSGRMRMNKIRILEGDRVTVEMSPFDLSRGRITYRSIDSNLLKSDAQKEKEAKEKARKERVEQEKALRKANAAASGAGDSSAE